MPTTLFFREGLTAAALGTVLMALDRFDLRVSVLLTPASNFWLELFQRDMFITPPRLSTRIKSYERIERAHGSRPRIVRAQFQSPGFVTVDGSKALEKLIDILHANNLTKDERRALMSRVQAETDLLEAQASKYRIEALSGAVAVMQSLNLSADQILRLLGGDRALINLLGRPIADLEIAQTNGDLQKVSVDTPMDK